MIPLPKRRKSWNWSRPTWPCSCWSSLFMARLAGWLVLWGVWWKYEEIRWRSFRQLQDEAELWLLKLRLVTRYAWIWCFREWNGHFWKLYALFQQETKSVRLHTYNRSILSHGINGPYKLIKDIVTKSNQWKIIIILMFLTVIYRGFSTQSFVNFISIENLLKYSSFWKTSSWIIIYYGYYRNN